MANQYRKRPVVIEAVRWTGDNLAEIKQFTAQLNKAGISSDAGGSFIVIPTLEGNMSANVGDWIIKGVAGEFYPCKPYIFDRTYEKVTDAST
jgi:hypothetical protein